VGSHQFTELANVHWTACHLVCMSTFEVNFKQVELDKGRGAFSAPLGAPPLLSKIKKVSKAVLEFLKVQSKSKDKARLVVTKPCALAWHAC